MGSRATSGTSFAAQQEAVLALLIRLPRPNGERQRRIRRVLGESAIDGVNLAVNLAQIYAWTNEKNVAIDQIAGIEGAPNNLSYGLLKLHPYWD